MSNIGNVGNSEVREYLSQEQTAHSRIDIREWEKKAEIFSSGHASENAEKIFKYIQKILNDPLFQENPQLFMKQWRDRRGSTEEWRHVEDDALLFFERELKL